MDARLSRRRTPRSTRLAAGALALVVLGALSVPAAARAQGAGADSVTLRWTATGDDGNTGTATRYDVRMSLVLIDSEAKWSSATVVPGPPTPLVSGTRQSMVVRSLTRGTTYYFAIKVIDDAGNVSSLSNVARWDWIADNAPPAAPTGVAATWEGANIRVSWSPNTEPDLGGYTVYRSLSQSGTYLPLNQSTITQTQYLDTAVPAGAAEVWYRVTASDLTGNESAQSSARRATLVAGTPEWVLGPAFPNPSTLSDVVTLPVVVPSGGSATAEVQIVDAGGRVVRRLPIEGREVKWNGRNEAGALVAPGVYTAWLVGGDARRNVKIVRAP